MIECPACLGSGWGDLTVVLPDDVAVCDHCDGRGTVPDPASDPKDPS